MSIEQTSSSDQTAAKRRPDLVGYSVRRTGGDGKAFWSKVGAAWAHKDGQGFDVRMDALPIDGRLVLREPNDRDETFVDDHDVSQNDLG